MKMVKYKNLMCIVFFCFFGLAFLQLDMQTDMDQGRIKEHSILYIMVNTLKNTFQVFEQ